MPDDRRSISRNVTCLNILVHDVIKLLYYEYWADRQKYFYIILQCLKEFPVLWSSDDLIKSTLFFSIRKTVFLLHSGKSPIDQSFFLKFLKDALIKVGHSSFDWRVEQDVVEVFEILLEELTGPSIVTSAAYNKSLISIIGHIFDQLSRTEDIQLILRLPVLKYFPTLLPKVLKKESLTGSNAPYCNICSGIRESDSKLSLLSVGNCLILQLNRFLVSNGTVTKNSAPFFVSSSI